MTARLDFLSLPGPWVKQAACDAGDDNVLYAEHGGRGLVAHGKALCAGCPVRMPCLQFALDNNEPHGIWGGMTPDERDQMRRGRVA